MPLQILVSSANEEERDQDDKFLLIPAICIRKRTGPRTVPWGTPDTTGSKFDILPSTATACFLEFGSRNEESHSPTFPVIPQPLMEWRRTFVSHLSKALENQCK